MRDQSTAHVIRGGVASRRASGWLELAAALAPEGFDHDRDGVCIHRSGTVLYLCPVMPRLLGLASVDHAVGLALVDLFPAGDRPRVAWALESGGRCKPGLSTQVTLHAFGEGMDAELTALRASEASPPVDVLYVRACGRGGLASREDGSVPGSEGRRWRDERAPTTVLICDDEARLSALTAGLLSEYGFVPITVGTGDEAIRVLEEHEPAIDVVLLDVNLSAGRSARDVLVAMRERGNAARVILTSGLAEEDVDADLVTDPSVVGYVAKPYGVDELIRTIRGALQQ